MPKFVVQMIDVYTQDVIETQDEIFDNENDAERYALECGSAFAEGAEVLSLAGRDYIPSEDVDFIVEELEDEE